MTRPRTAGDERVRPTRINLFDDPITVTGTFLSVIAGLVSYLVSDNDAVLGFVVGIQVQALTLLVQPLLQQQRRETRPGASGALLGAIESVDWLPAVVRSISADVARVEQHYDHTVAPDAVRRVLDTCQTQLHELARGHLYVDSYDPSLKLELLCREASTLRTTSLEASDLAGHLSRSGAPTGAHRSRRWPAAGRSSASLRRDITTSATPTPTSSASSPRAARSSTASPSTRSTSAASSRCTPASTTSPSPWPTEPG